MSDPASYWEQIYTEKAVDDVSWYQSRAAVSLKLITKYGLPGPLIDVGSGASVLADQLLTSGCTDLTLLDISATGLGVTRRRLGAAAEEVSFVVADLLTWQPARQFATWHDRAVFHFLTDPVDRDSYVRIAASALLPGGVVVLGAFAEDGPEQCSGLPTARYDAASLAAQFAVGFSVVTTAGELHRTPWGSEQPFTWVVLRRTGDS